MPEEITSRKNSLVRQAAAIRDSAQKRREQGLFFVEGARLVQDAALSKIEPVHLFYTGAAYKKYADYLKEPISAADKAFVVQEHVAEFLASTKNSQGIFCLCRIPKPSPAVPGEKIMVLEQVQDPGNLGGILRTGEALGIRDFILLGGCCDPYSPKAVRASMGAVFRAWIRCFNTAGEGAEFLNGLGVVSFAAVPDRGAEPITKIGFPKSCAMWIGNEGNGLSKEAKQLCQRHITIPMAGRAESLNAFTAAAILMWEMVKDINF